MVSEMDRAAETLIRITSSGPPRRRLPREESGAHHGTSGLRWVVDPLDGTTNYLYDHVGWNVSIASRTATAAWSASWSIRCSATPSPPPEAVGPAWNGVPISCSSAVDLAALPLRHRVRLRPGAPPSAGGGRAGPAARPRHPPVLGQRHRPRPVACGWPTPTGSGAWTLGPGGWCLIAWRRGAIVDDDESTGLVVAAGPGVFDAFRGLLIDAGAASA